MTPVTTFAGKRLALFGLGASGLAAAHALLAGGALVDAWDDHAAARDKANAAGVFIRDLADADWSVYAALVLSPGAPLTHPAPHWSVERARALGVPVIGDIELFCLERATIAPTAPFVAITGTNGKSTTTSLIAHILASAGYDAQLGGNIGTPVLALEPPQAGRVHVLECSSFQIDLAPSLAPSVGVLLNLTPDHLDRHGDMATYAAVKERLVGAADHAVVGLDDDYCRAIHARLLAARLPTLAISQDAEPRALRTRLSDRRLRRVIPLDGGAALDETLIDLNKAAALRGAHNGQNAAAAFCACEWLGLAHTQIAAGMLSYPGLPHRMEEVGRLGRVLFVNDSKATNADAAEKALLSYDDIFWIAGGQAKDGGIEMLRPLYRKIRKAYLIGAAGEDFARALDGAVESELCGALDTALERAADDASRSNAREPVVLLSPACASYDQFANFEVRGDRFRDLARAIIARRVPAMEATL